MVAAGGGGSYQSKCHDCDYSNINGGNGGALVGKTPIYVGAYAEFSSLNPTGGSQTSGRQSQKDWNHT